jgi:hypothetical protein
VLGAVFSDDISIKSIAWLAARIRWGSSRSIEVRGTRHIFEYGELLADFHDPTIVLEGISHRYIEPLALVVHTRLSSESIAAESIATVEDGWDNDKAVVPLAGEKKVRLPFARPSITTGTKVLDVVFPDSWAVLLRFLLGLDGLPPSAFEIFVHSRQVPDETWRTYSPATFPFATSNTRNLCLSTARVSRANEWPSGENELSAAREAEPVTAGCDNALVASGRDFGGFCVDFFCFLDTEAIAGGWSENDFPPHVARKFM